MDRKLPNPISSNLTAAQMSPLDKCCGSKSNFSFGVHILLRSTTVLPLTGPGAAASDIVRVIKEYVNEMPYWKNHWEPLVVNLELAECVYDELIAKNWGMCPRYLRATVHLMAAFTEVNYVSWPMAFIYLPLSADVHGTYMGGKEDYNDIHLVSISFALAGRISGDSPIGPSCISMTLHRRTLHRTLTSNDAMSKAYRNWIPCLIPSLKPSRPYMRSTTHSSRTSSSPPLSSTSPWLVSKLLSRHLHLSIPLPVFLGSSVLVVARQFLLLC